MKRTKALKVILVMFTILAIFTVNVYASAPGDNARTVENPEEANQNEENQQQEGEPVPINEENGEAIPTDEDGIIDDGHNHETIDPDSIHQGDRYIAFEENTYEMSELINGNLFIMGKGIKFSGQVNGDVFAFAQEFTMTEDAYIGGRLFLASGNATINGMVVDIYSASQDLKVEETAFIYRDINSVAENITLSGTVGRNAKITAKKLEIPETETPLNIYGNLEYQASNKIEGIEEKANITGEVKYTHYEEKERDTADIVWDLVTSV